MTSAKLEYTDLLESRQGNILPQPSGQHVLWFHHQIYLQQMHCLKVLANRDLALFQVYNKACCSLLPGNECMKIGLSSCSCRKEAVRHLLAEHKQENCGTRTHRSSHCCPQHYNGTEDRQQSQQVQKCSRGQKLPSHDSAVELDGFGHKPAEF